MKISPTNDKLIYLRIENKNLEYGMPNSRISYQK